MIRDPGKFYGCPDWAPGFYEAWLDGFVESEPTEECDCADAGVHCDHWLSTRISELDEELQCRITQDCEGMAVVPKHVLWRECDNGLMEFEVE